MRRCAFLLCNTIQRAPEAVSVVKDYQKLNAERKELAEAERKRKELENYPLRYQILECRPGLPLALTKLKYLLAARRTHPEAGGDAESFLRVSLAYQDVMKDYGVETVDNKVVNLGNFQTDDHEAQNYLDARSRIKSYIPISTLDDHIKQIEAVQERLGDELSQKLAAETDEAMWLLEDIEDVLEQTGLKTVRLQVLEDGKIKVADHLTLTDGTEKPIFLPKDECSSQEGKGEYSKNDETRQDEHSEKTDASDAGVSGVASTEGEEAKKAIFETEVSASDIEVLNAKNNLQDRTDVAGLASRTATEVMNNTSEVKEIRMEGAVLYVLAVCILVVIYVYIEGHARAKQQQKSRPQTMEHVQSDTMLPWWGNDAEYESQVKRIFVEEWRRARATSRRAGIFQDGVARESMDDETKKKMDLQIFTVTAERLRDMRDQAEKHPGRQ